MIRLVEEQRRSREPFVVHADLHLLPTGGGGTWAKALDYLLELEDVRKDVSPREPDARLRACDVRRSCCGTSSATSSAGRPATSRATSGTGSRARRRWPASGERSSGRVAAGGAVLAAVAKPVAVRPARPDVRDRLRVRHGARIGVAGRRAGVRGDLDGPVALAGARSERRPGRRSSARLLDAAAGRPDAAPGRPVRRLLREPGAGRATSCCSARCCWSPTR